MRHGGIVDDADILDGKNVVQVLEAFAAEMETSPAKGLKDARDVGYDELAVLFGADHHHVIVRLPDANG